MSFQQCQEYIDHCYEKIERAPNVSIQERYMAIIRRTDAYLCRKMAEDADWWLRP